MRIVVTGGAGFIGSHVCEALLERGDSVICVDNFDDYYEEGRKQSNISSCMGSDDFELARLDIRDEVVGEILSGVDAVIHLAAKAGVRNSIERPEEYYDVNVNGTLNLLELAAENDIDNFVFASSSSVYGVNENVPFQEGHKLKPISPYAASKVSGESTCHVYSHLHDLNVNCLRFFTVYGPRNRPDMAVYKFTDLIANDEPIEMYGDGTSKRDYTFVKDIVQGILGAVDNNEGFDIYNLGNNRTVQLKKLISTIELALGKEAEIIQKPVPPGDVPITYADISKAKRDLDYNPATTIEEGIQEFVDWYEENV